MTTVPSTSGSTVGGAAPRLSLKLLAPPSGHVDGGWWPHSRDLALEAPGLARAAAKRLGPVLGITYVLDAWAPAPRRVLVAHEGTPPQEVTLAGSVWQDLDRVVVTAVSGRSLSLLVVPPEATDRDGRDAMNGAAAPWRRDLGDHAHRGGSSVDGTTRTTLPPQLHGVARRAPAVPTPRSGERHRPDPA